MQGCSVCACGYTIMEKVASYFWHVQPTITMIGGSWVDEAFKYHWLRVKTGKEASWFFVGIGGVCLFGSRMFSVILAFRLVKQPGEREKRRFRLPVFVACVDAPH